MRDWAADTDADAIPESVDAPPEPQRLGPALSFRTRLTIALVLVAVVPVLGFGALVLLVSAVTGGGSVDPTLSRLLLFAIALAALFGVLMAYVLVADLTRPMRAIAAAVERVSAGDLSTPIAVGGEDELSRLAESHNRLAADLERRNRELGRILEAIESATPRAGVEGLAERAAADAKAAFAMIDCTFYMVDPREIPVEEDVPGDPRPVRADLRVGGEPIGVLVGHLPATRRWDRADQHLLELFAREVAVAIRNAQLFRQVEAQNAQLLELDAAKDEFLRGVSHNLQTPLTSIRAYAEQLRDNWPDRRLGIIAEQTDRLSRMVRQLLTVSRLESGALRPRAEVFSLAARVRRAWEALAAEGVGFELDDRSQGWLVVADQDQLDQVLWALLDNAVKYGGGQPIEVVVDLDAEEPRVRATIADRGPGVPESDRGRLFGRFERGADQSEEGSGLGLYVSRELCRAMGGDLVLAPPRPGHGAAFTIILPGEPPEEA